MSDQQPNPELSTACALVDEAVASLERLVRTRTADPSVPIVGRVSAAIDGLVRAAMIDPDVAVGPSLRSRIPAVLFELAPAVAADVHPAISKDRVYFGLGAAAALFTNVVDPFWPDRLAHAGLLSAELRAFVCRGEIKRRGDPLMRAVLAQRAWDGQLAPDVFTH